MSLVALLSLTLMGAAQTAAYQVAPPSPAAQALNSPRPAPASYTAITNAPAPVQAAEKTLMPGELHKFGPAPRSLALAGPFLCVDGKCKTRAPIYNTQTVDQREPDGRDHYSSDQHAF